MNWYLVRYWISYGIKVVLNVGAIYALFQFDTVVQAIVFPAILVVCAGEIIGMALWRTFPYFSKHLPPDYAPHTGLIVLAYVLFGIYLLRLL